VRQHNRFGAAFRTRREQFERSPPIGLGNTLAAALLGVGIGKECSLRRRQFATVITARKQMPVHVHGDGDRGVPHALLHDLGRQH
jgi:hypothetical protein